MQRPGRVFPIALTAVAVLAATTLLAQAALHPVLGTWHLNVGKSTFEGIAAPGRRSMIFVALGDAVKHITETLPAGVPGIVVAGATEYTARYDGIDVFIMGSFLDSVALRRVDARTVERTGKVGGRVVETMTMVVSPDGRTLTITTQGTNPNTMVEYRSVQVLEKDI